MRINQTDILNFLPSWSRTEPISEAICTVCNPLLRDLSGRLKSLPMEAAQERTLLLDDELSALATDLVIPFYYEDSDRETRENVVFGFGNTNNSRGTYSTLLHGLELIFGEGAASILENTYDTAAETDRWTYRIEIDTSKARLSSNGTSMFRIMDLCHCVGRAAMGLDSVRFDVNNTHTNIAVAVRVSSFTRSV